MQQIKNNKRFKKERYTFMKIQIGHSREFDFEKLLYTPLMQSNMFKEHTFVLPHSGEVIDSFETLKNVDIFVCEISYPSTGL